MRSVFADDGTLVGFGVGLDPNTELYAVQELRAWKELEAKRFHEQRTTGPPLFGRAQPPPPPAGCNVAFEDLMLDA